MSNLLLKKIFFISVALLASAVPFGQAQAQTVKPDNFPEGQEVPLPGPVQSGQVTLWQLPEDYRSVIKTEEGDVYGIYYSAWNRPNSSVLPGVFGSAWIAGDNKYQPWKGNPDLAKELSEKYFINKGSFMVNCPGDGSLGLNCVVDNNGDAVKNLNLYGFWNGGGFAYGEAKNGDGSFVLRPSGDKGFNNATAYYWNGDLYRTASDNQYKIQFFAGCKLTTISSDHYSSDLGSVDDCNKGVAPIFQGGTLSFAEGPASTAENLYLNDVEGNTIDNAGHDVELSGVLSGPGGMIYTGLGVTTLSGTAAYEGATVVEAGTLNLKASPGRFDVASSLVDVKEDATLQLEAPSSDAAEFFVNSLSLQDGSKLNKVGGWAFLFVQNQKDGLDTQGDVTIDVAVPDGSNPQIENGLHINASAWSGDGTITKEGRGVLAIGCERNSESECSAIGFTGETSYDYAGTIKVEQGFLSLYRASLPKASIDVSSESVLEVGVFKAESGANRKEGVIEIGALSGDGRVIIDTDEFVGGQHKVELQVGSANVDSTFSGVISGSADGGGSADFAKVGSGKLTLAGANTYEGKTTIGDGVLALANASGIPQASSTLVTGSGRLDLATNLIGGGEFRIDQLSIEDGGRLFVRASQPLISQKIVLNANDADLANPGGIAVALKSKNEPPIRVSETFDYQSGSLVVAGQLTDDPEGTWKIIDGKVENADELAKNTFLVVEGQKGGGAYKFEGLGEENAVTGMGAVYEGYLEEGSLDLVVQVNDNLECLLDPDSCKEEGTEKPPVIPPFQPPTCEDFAEDCSISNEFPDTDGDGEPDVIDKDDDNDGIPDDKDPDADGDGELDQLPGCEVGDDLCDIISDIEGDEDEAWEEEEEDAGEIVDALLDGVEDEEIDLPLSFDYGQLARLVGSGLAPRNVDAAGRGLALHNNLLVDAVFERQPLRQFEDLVASEAVVEDKAVVEDEAVIEETAPAQPLWLKSEELNDGEAAEYVEGAVADVEVADAADPEAADAETADTASVEVSLVDLQDDELDLAKRDGVSAWVKGFGGNSRADDSSILYNDYDLNAYGTSFGVDVALSETFQIGAYANYGDLNVNQHSGETGGGSWNPEGWGGGLTAQYSTRHFYVQGLLGASEFSGEQSRNILRINEDLGGNTARGDKSVTSYLGALRMGAPFKTGGVVLEPQGQVVWTRNHEQGFSETRGTEKNLRLKYKSRTTNFAETELGMKLSVPIRTGERALLVPSVRAAWLADWNQGNEGQEIGYKFTNKTVNFDSQLGTENGALIEAGLDYTVQNVNGISVKLYGRGGMEFWASDRGTTWRASGGVTFQF